MTRVKILRTFPIAVDGINVEHWPADSIKAVDDATLQILIGEGACEIVEDKAIKAAPETKAKRTRRK